MTVFKAFFKVVSKYKFILILYTVLLVGFTGFNMTTNDNSVEFVADKPDVLIINHDEDKGITKALVEYIKANCNIIDIKDEPDAIKDALFYRDVNLIIYIPENYRIDFLNGLNPEIKIESTGDYESSLAELLLSRFIENANVYLKERQDEEKIIEKVQNTIKLDSDIKVTSKLDSDNLDRAVYYFNFLNYSLLAGCVYIICVVLSSFRTEKIQKRTIISSMNYKKHNRLLLLSNGVLTFTLWLFYIILSFIIIGKIMFSVHGIILIVNSFIFAICSLTIAFLIANIINKKEALSGIVNVVALGSSFLCGSFVPIRWLPDYILKIAHILPSYWFVQNNELVRTLEEINSKTLNPLIINLCILVGFIIFFIIISNFISRKKRRIV